MPAACSRARSRRGSARGFVCADSSGIASMRWASAASSSSLMACSEPARVVAALQVVQPGLVVHALGDLQEQEQVLRPQVQLALRPAEVEAAVRRQLALGVLAAVAAALGLAGLDPARTDGGRPSPRRHSSTSPGSQLARRRPAARSPDAPCRTASSVRSPPARPPARCSTQSQHGGRHLVGVDGDEQQPGRSACGSVSGAGSQAAGSRWWASSTTSQCGRPVRARSSCKRGSRARKNAGRSASGRPTQVDDDVLVGLRQHAPAPRRRSAPRSVRAQVDGAGEVRRSRPRGR